MADTTKHHLRIVGGQTGQDTRVYLNQHNISSALRGVDFSVQVGELTTATLTLACQVHEVQGQCDVAFELPEMDLAGYDALIDHLVRKREERAMELALREKEKLEKE